MNDEPATKNRTANRRTRAEWLRIAQEVSEASEVVHRGAIAIAVIAVLTSITGQHGAVLFMCLLGLVMLAFGFIGALLERWARSLARDSQR